MTRFIMGRRRKDERRLGDRSEQFNERGTSSRAALDPSDDTRGPSFEDVCLPAERVTAAAEFNKDKKVFTKFI